MFLIDENKRKISGACRSFVLYLDFVAISPFIYFNSNWGEEKKAHVTNLLKHNFLNIQWKLFKIFMRYPNSFILPRIDNVITIWNELTCLSCYELTSTIYSHRKPKSHKHPRMEWSWISQLLEPLLILEIMQVYITSFSLLTKKVSYESEKVCYKEEMTPEDQNKLGE